MAKQNTVTITTSKECTIDDLQAELKNAGIYTSIALKSENMLLLTPQLTYSLDSDDRANALYIDLDENNSLYIGEGEHGSREEWIWKYGTGKPLTINDLATLIIGEGEHGSRAEWIWKYGTGKPLTINDLATLIIDK